jgi:phosphate transport system substrate-binding protein
MKGIICCSPTVVGAVVPIVNLPGLVGQVSFTPGALAGIYLGKIKKWNDPVLTRANRSLRLPDLDIVVVHRSDGSGTTYAWTDYLSQTSPHWKTEIGARLAPTWPKRSRSWADLSAMSSSCIWNCPRIW